MWPWPTLLMKGWQPAYLILCGLKGQHPIIAQLKGAIDAGESFSTHLLKIQYSRGSAQSLSLERHVLESRRCALILPGSGKSS